jgi:hypothetical protein
MASQQPDIYVLLQPIGSSDAMSLASDNYGIVSVQPLVVNAPTSMRALPAGDAA